MSKMLEAALTYARRGWAVFPCKPGSKEPATQNGFKDATTDPEQIPGWWARSPMANPAIATGERSGVWALDPDNHGGKDGLATLAELERQHGALPHTPAQRTGSGGEHRLFRMNGVDVRNSAGKLGPGIDVRGNGGYIVLPPSVHPNGSIYEWLDDAHPADVEPADAPEWLYALIQKKPEANRRKADTVGERPNWGIRDAYVRAAVEGELNRVLSASTGSRNDTLNLAAFALGQFVGAGVLDRADIEGRLLRAARVAGLDENEAIKTINSGLNAGEAQPREMPRQRGNDNAASQDEEEDWESYASAKPDPIAPAAPTWPELEPNALYGLPGDVVRAISPHSEADPVAILSQFLIAVGNALSRQAYYLVEGDRHFTNMFAVMVGDSAKGRKGTSWGRVRAIMEVAADHEWAAGRILSGMSSGEGLIWAVRDPIMGYEKQGKGAAAERALVEVDPGIRDKRLMVIEPEFARAIAVMRRDGNTLSAVLRDAWDRGDLSSLTKNSPARATGAHISVIGHITTDELRAVLDRTAMANGSANRILWTMVRRSNVLPFGGNMDPQVVKDLGRRTGAMIGASRNVARVGFDAEASELWCRVYAELSAGRAGLLGAITNRAEAQVIRLALVYALLDNAGTISGNHLRAAVAVWQYAEASCEYIWRDALGNPVADEILRVLRLAGSAGKIRTEIRDLFGRHRSADEIGAALTLLATEGKATYTLRAGANGGPAEVWVATTWG